MIRSRAAALAILALAGCTSSAKVAPAGGDKSTSATGRDTGGGTGSITVLAAASLTGAFTQVGAEFEKAHPGVKVTFSFGSSADLATQITNGAPADVFAAASPTTMQTVVRARDAADPVTFAKNSLEIATPPDNPAKVLRLGDLARKGLKLAVCQAKVPCGAAAATLFAKSNVDAHPVTYEKDVKATLVKVEQGEVDAGVVYVTDVLAAGTKVHGITIAPDSNVTTAYPIAALSQAKNAATAKAFISYVSTAHGLAVLKTAGFAAP